MLRPVTARREESEWDLQFNGRVQCRLPSTDVTPQCFSGSYSRLSFFLSLVEDGILLLVADKLVLLLLLLPLPLVVLDEDDEEDDDDEDEDDDEEAEEATLELLRFPPFPDGDALMDEVLSLLTPDEVEADEAFLSEMPVLVEVKLEEDSCFSCSRKLEIVLLDSVGGLDSCADNLELLELLLELDDFPLWCEELCDEETLLPFLPFSFELELLLRILSGVLSKSSCLEELPPED